LLDGQERIVAVHAIKHYPIVVSATTTVASALFEWRRLTQILTGAGLLGTFVIGLVFALISKQVAREGKRSKGVLAEQKHRLETALSNMSQGLCMFGSDGRLVVANERYAEMYGLTSEQVRPGTSVQEILAFRVANGFYSGAAEDYVWEQIAVIGNRSASDRVLELNDGRFIAVKYRPMPDGGWVATHEDISSLRCAEKAAIEASARAERTAREAQAAHARLREAFQVVPEGLVLFDAENRYVLWNNRYTELYGESDVGVGKTFEEVVRQGLAGGQYPDAEGREEQWLAERLQRFTRGASSHEQRLPNGRWVRVEERRIADGGAIGVRVDITEMKAREEALHMQNMRFETVLSNMTEGVCLFDADQKLVICNTRYAEIYCLPPELVVPGTSLRHILQHRTADGLINAESQRIIEEEVEQNRPVTKSIELNDGRIIAIKHQPVAGGGWVSTHEDITVREHLRVELQQQEEQLNIALENMSQGLAMFDGHQRVIVCNRRYAAMYGLTMEQVKPGTTVRQIAEHRIAKGVFAGSSPQAYLQERVGRVFKDTDVIHKLSDGRVIALSVRVMPDGSGVSTHDDITERENLKERLDAALNNMAQDRILHRKWVLCGQEPGRHGCFDDEAPRRKRVGVLHHQADRRTRVRRVGRPHVGRRRGRDARGHHRAAQIRGAPRALGPP